MIGSVRCSALKYLQGVNIYQQSVKGHGLAVITGTHFRLMDVILFFLPMRA